MRIIVTGGNGQLGKSLKKMVVNYKDNSSTTDISQKVIPNIKFTDISSLDITDPEQCSQYFHNNPCNFLINCAAYTNVREAEKNADTAFAINTKGVENLAHSSLKYNFKIIHISTDYVFDGCKLTPYKESAGTNPLNVYGMTKLSGEECLMKINPDSIIIRTSWLYSEFGGNFFDTISKKASSGEVINVVSDQIGTPTYASDLAEVILRIISGDNWRSGLYHYSNEGSTSWYGFAKEIYRLMNRDTELVRPVTSENYGVDVKRPAYSVLDKTKIKETFNITIPDWESSLKKLAWK